MILVLCVAVLCVLGCMCCVEYGDYIWIEECCMSSAGGSLLVLFEEAYMIVRLKCDGCCDIIVVWLQFWFCSICKVV